MKNELEKARASDGIANRLQINIKQSEKEKKAKTYVLASAMVGKRKARAAMNRLLCILVIIVLITGCANRINEGTVYEKEHQESWTQVMLMPITTLVGKVVITNMIPYTIYHSENWIIWIESDGETEDFYVTEEYYNSIEVGDYFIWDDSKGFESEKVVKEKGD